MVNVDTADKMAIRALSRDQWSICDDLRKDPANEDEVVGLILAAMLRCQNEPAFDAAMARAKRIYKTEFGVEMRHE